MRRASTAEEQVTRTSSLSVKIPSPSLLFLDFLISSCCARPATLQYFAGHVEKIFSHQPNGRATLGTAKKRHWGADLKRLRKISLSDVDAYLRKNARQVLGLALFALLMHDIFGAHGFIAMRRTQKQIDQVREQIGKLNEENKSLSSQVNSLKSDPNAIERIAREEMGLARPGEIIYKLPDSAKPGDPQKPNSQK